MVVGVTVFVVVLLIAAIWVFVEVKRLRHKIFAVFLVALILFTYLSFTLVIQKHDVNLGSVPGIIDAGKLYLSWLGSIFSNFKSITLNAINMDWSGGNSSGG